MAISQRRPSDGGSDRGPEREPRAGVREGEPCPSCELTPVGSGVLRRELERLLRRDPPGRWSAEVCEECEGVCLVVDGEEGWTLGSPSVGPVRVLGPGVPAGPAEPSPPATTSDPEGGQEEADPRVVVRRIVAKVGGRPRPPAASATPVPPVPAVPAVRVPPPAPEKLPGGGSALPEAWAFSSGRRGPRRRGPGEPDEPTESASPLPD